MPWYYRTSFKFGPGRVTFSKSGISYSVGTKDARLTTGPRGTYVTISTHGLRYRQRFVEPSHHHNGPVVPSDKYTEPLVHTITSGSIDRLTDNNSRAFVDELNKKSNRISYFKWFCIAPALLFILFVFSYFSQESKKDEKIDYFVKIDPTGHAEIKQRPDAKGKNIAVATADQQFSIVDMSDKAWNKIRYADTIGFISKRAAIIDSTKTIVRTYSRFETDERSLISVILIGSAFFTWLGIGLYKQDKARLTVEIYYEIDANIQGIYDRFLANFGEIQESQRVWQYLHAESTTDYKRNAGAGNLITRVPVKRISGDYKPAKFFHTNIPIPNLKLKNTDLYFFPERLIIKRDGKFAAIFYNHLSIESDERIFIEDGSVPSDARVVGHTWRFLNKNGSPDRRFNNNRQLTKCLYTHYQLSSPTGLNEVITTSKQSAFDNFAQMVRTIGQFQNAQQKGNR